MAVAAALLAVGLTAPVRALPQYWEAAISHYGLVDDPRVVSCVLCHTTPLGGPPWNPFGMDVLNALGRAGGDIVGALDMVDSLDLDSDGDGYPNALELFAGTLPGDPDSRPLATVERLLEDYLAARGAGR
jgi:hypothetical protein